MTLNYSDAMKVKMKINRIEEELILKLPIGGFVSPKTAAEILGVSISTLKRITKVIKVRRGMMFLYDKISIAKYKDTGDGYYFILNRTVKNRIWL
jgi:hypothetical protein